MIENRLWRPVAQRSVRNAWGYVQAQYYAWSASSATARLAATNLVNAYLSHGDVGLMDLGVLCDMEGIRDKARIKLQAQQKLYLQQYLESYDALVHSVVEMRSIAGSMRNYAKDTGGGPLLEFAKTPMVDCDTGDGGGVAVFAVLPLCTFGRRPRLSIKLPHFSYDLSALAKDLVTMFQKELKVKWLLALEFHNLVYQNTAPAYSGGLGPLIYIPMDESDKYRKPDEVSSAVPDRQLKPPSRETLKVYLTALIAEVNIDKDRFAEVSRLWNEEMTGGFVGNLQ